MSESLLHRRLMMQQQTLYTEVLAVHLNILFTEHIVTSKTRLDTVIRFKNSGRVSPYGGRTNDFKGIFNYGGNRFDWLDYGGPGKSYTLSIDYNAWYSLSHGYENGVARVRLNEIERIYDNTEFVTNRDLSLFNGELNYGSAGEMQRTRVYEDDVLVRDYIPCVRNSDGAIGMYDIMNGVFTAGDNTSYVVYS